MRTMTMVVWMLALGCLTSVMIQTSGQPGGPGSGSGSGPGSGFRPGGHFSQDELMDLADAIVAARDEQEFLQNQVNMILMQKQDLLAKLDRIDEDLDDFDLSNAQQDFRLEGFKDEIKGALHRAGNLQGGVAQQNYVAQGLNRAAHSFSLQIDALGANDDFQDARIQTVRTFLQQAKEKLEEKLHLAVEVAESQVETVAESTENFRSLVRSKKCKSWDVEIHLYEDDFVENVTINFNASFYNGNVPAVFCAIKEFHSLLDFGQSYPVYGYHGYQYERERQSSTGLTVDCKPFNDHIQVFAFDNSRGGDNRQLGVVVEVKACSYAAQATGPGGLGGE